MLKQALLYVQVEACEAAKVICDLAHKSLEFVVAKSVVYLPEVIVALIWRLWTGDLTVASNRLGLKRWAYFAGQALRLIEAFMAKWTAERTLQPENSICFDEIANHRALKPVRQPDRGGNKKK